LFWGEPGTGKSALIKQICAILGLSYYRLSPAERGEGQFGVVPVPGADGFLHYPPPEWAKDLQDGGVLFLDEISTAPPALQAPILGTVQLRVIGSYQFCNRVRCIGAANETQDAAGGWDLAPPLCNRFGHFDFKGLSADAWSEALLSGFGSQSQMSPESAEELEKRVLVEWPNAIATARGKIASFISRRPELLHKRPAPGAQQKSWPSRRSVEYVTVALASAKIHNLSEMDTDEFMAAFVGQGWVSEFRAWEAHLDLPQPSEILDGKVKFEHEARRLDRTMVVLNACAAMLIFKECPNLGSRLDVFWTLIESTLKNASEAAVPAARVVMRQCSRQGVDRSDVEKRVLVKLHPIMEGAGLLGSR